ncbi:MAG: radical SAM protein [Candidatus Cloacimonetes bacterium]|nr:radical SAM protein [Candidatus Cloacimonadota bacterium]
MTILPIFIPHLGCLFRCVYCNQKLITKSKIPTQEDIKNRIKEFCKNNPDNEKEVAFFGGTFTNLNQKKQQEFFDSVNLFKNKISGIRISTRPDSIDLDILYFCKQNNVKTIELGIQSFNDDVLLASKRGYNSQIAQQACYLIQEFKFKLGVQLMPGLPKFSKKTLDQTIQTTIDINPDFVRIYPTILLAGTELEKRYLKGKYHPLELNEAIKFVSEMIQQFKKHKIKVTKVGLHSDIDERHIAAGPYHQSFGELVRGEMLLKRIVDNFEDKTLMISSADISLFKGFNSQMLKSLKTQLNLDKIPIIIDNNLDKNNFLFTEQPPQEYW